jgi:hypothetical protein
MPTGPMGQKRPRDPNQLAKLIVDIATGQVEDRKPTPEEQGKDPAAVIRGRKGGQKGGAARAGRLTAEERSAAARIIQNIRNNAVFVSASAFFIRNHIVYVRAVATCKGIAEAFLWVG